MCSKPFRRKKVNVHQFMEKAGCTDEHHLISRSKGGESLSSNLLRIDVYKHDAWHLLFGNKTIDEIVKLLKKFKDYKEFMRTINHYHKHRAYQRLLGKRTIEEAVVLMLRIKSIKKAQSQKMSVLFGSAKSTKFVKAA